MGFWKFFKGILLRGESSDPSTTEAGAMWHNETDGRIRSHLESATREFVTTDQDQTITNKTIALGKELQFTEISTPANPPTGEMLFYPKSDGNFYKLDHAGLESVFASGGSTFSDNLFTIQDNGDTSKQAQFQAGSISTLTTRTFTFPDEDTTLVGTGATQSLTNKTLNNTNTITLKDTNFTIQDDGDTTKQAKFNVSGVSTGTTRTFSVPDVNDTLVTLTATQTLTNKSLSDSTTAIVDSGDPTKQIKFNAAGTTGTSTTLTTGQTADVIVTIPGSTTTLVGRDTSDSLTQKTIGESSSQSISNALNFFELGGTPSSNPSSGILALYPKSDHIFYTLTNAGVETPLLKNPTIQRFTTGTSVQYNTPTGARWIKVRLVGGAGGGGGSGTNGGGGTAATAGTASTFVGSGTISAGGGSAGSQHTGATAACGAASVGMGTTLVAVSGGSGQGGSGQAGGTTTAGSPLTLGGSGGNSFFGGSGGGGGIAGGLAGAANSGSGGGGGGASNQNIVFGGGGGGAGAYTEVIITSPAATYTYTVGQNGTAGTAGTNGQAGGDGGAGLVLIEEYYN